MPITVDFPSPGLGLVTWISLRGLFLAPEVERGSHGAEGFRLAAPRVVYGPEALGRLPVGICVSGLAVGLFGAGMAIGLPVAHMAVGFPVGSRKGFLGVVAGMCASAGKAS